MLLVKWCLAILQQVLLTILILLSPIRYHLDCIFTYSSIWALYKSLFSTFSSEYHSLIIKIFVFNTLLLTIINTLSLTRLLVLHFNRVCFLHLLEYVNLLQVWITLLILNLIWCIHHSSCFGYTEFIYMWAVAFWKGGCSRRLLFLFAQQVGLRLLS